MSVGAAGPDDMAEEVDGTRRAGSGCRALLYWFWGIEA